MAKCSNVSSLGITALTDSTVQLQQLNLSYCKKVIMLISQTDGDGCVYDRRTDSLLNMYCSFFLTVPQLLEFCICWRFS